MGVTQEFSSAYSDGRHTRAADQHTRAVDQLFFRWASHKNGQLANFFSSIDDEFARAENRVGKQMSSPFKRMRHTAHHLVPTRKSSPTRRISLQNFAIN